MLTAGVTTVRDAVKRATDVAIAAPALIVLSPLLALVATAVALTLGRPVLFRQIRPGRSGVPFAILKFRTMSEARDASGALLPDAARLSRLGRFLRRTSLDELPQLWNVVRGDMSLVGPRPLLMHYLPHYSAEQARRHDVRPGLTGWAQIHGRNMLDWPERLAKDVWYVDNRSLRLDATILLVSFWQAALGRGVVAEGEAPMVAGAGEPAADARKRPGATPAAS